VDGLYGKRIGRLVRVDATKARLLLGVQSNRRGRVLENRQIVEDLLLLGVFVLLFRFFGPGFFSHPSTPHSRHATTDAGSSAPAPDHDRSPTGYERRPAKSCFSAKIRKQD